MNNYRFFRRVQCKSAIIFLILVLASVSEAGVPVQEAPSEYKIKAIFLYNFSQFVDWPKAAFPEPGTPMIMGILGKDPFGYYLDETIKDEEVNNHPMRVKRFRNVKEVNVCHILFISGSGKEDLKDIVDQLKSQPVLTVGDSEDFIKKGGMVRFLTEDNKTRIQINLEAVKLANLTISSKLLGVAEIVSSSKK